MIEWWHIVVFYMAVFIAGYVWGAAQTIAKNDIKLLARKKGRSPKPPRRNSTSV